MHEALTVADTTTSAGGRVYVPGDWPLSLTDFPVILLQMTGEQKESLGRSGAPQFTVTTTIRISCRVASPAGADDLGANLAEAALWGFQREVELAVINYTPITAITQQIAFVRSQLGISSDGARHIGELRIEIGFEFYQGPEDFCPPELDELDEAGVSAPELPGDPGVLIPLT